MSHISYNEEVWDSYALPKEDPKIYKSGDTFLDRNWRQYLFTRNQQFLLYQKIQI